MIYFYNGSYYIKRFSKLIKVDTELNKYGDVLLIPTEEKITIDDAEGCIQVTLNSVADSLKKGVKEVKIEKDEVKVEEEKSETKKTSFNKYKKFN